VQIARDALLDLRHSPLHLGAREILVPIIDRLELAAVDRDASFGEEAHRAAQHNKPAADLADGTAVVLAEIGDRLVIRNPTSRQPHHLHIASGLALEPSARLDPVQIAVNIELQEDRRMIGGSPCRFRIDPAEIERTEIKLLDKHVNHTNRVVLVDPIIQAFGKQRRLPAVRPLDKALHRDLPPKIASEPYHARRFHTAWVTSSGLIMSRLGQVSLTKPTYRGVVLRCCSVPQAKPSPDYEYRISLRPHPVGHPSSSTRDSASRAVPSSIRTRRDGYREAGEWQQAEGDQRDRATQKVFARAGSCKPRSDQHQECSTGDNHGYRRLACRFSSCPLAFFARQRDRAV